MSVVIYALIEALGKKNLGYTLARLQGRYWDDELLSNTQTIAKYWRDNMIWSHKKNEDVQKKIECELYKIRLKSNVYKPTKRDKKEISLEILDICNNLDLPNPFNGKYGNIANGRFGLDFGALASFGEWHGRGIEKGWI